MNIFGASFSTYFGHHSGIPCFTEHNRTDVETLSHFLFRGHPFYRGSSWHDWALFSWKLDDESETNSNIPGRILFFLDLTSVKNHPHYDSGLYAVVQSLTGEPTRVAGSRLLRKGVMRNGLHYHVCHVDSIVDVCFVVRNIGISNEYIVLSSPSQWPQLFL
jgi:hypothetical protein